jgi:uncharacterized protein
MNATKPPSDQPTTGLFKNRIESVGELESLVGLPGELVIRKELSELDAHMRAFIDDSPFVLIGTSGADGRLDVSPRGDLRAVARVLGPKDIIIADRPGNRRVDSLRNIIATGRIALLFLVPGMGETLRVNGHACVMRDEEHLKTLAVAGKTPILGIGVEVEECFFQCAKALIRSKLWDHHSQHANASPEHFAQTLLEQTSVADETVESLAEKINAAYRDRLY